MAISYPLAFPTNMGAMTITWTPKTVAMRSMSPMSLVEQVVNGTGQRWDAHITMPPMDRADAAEFFAFALKLKGTGTFLFTPPDAATPRGTANTTPGTPVVFGAAQSGNELIIDGLPLSEVGYLLAGDYINLGSGSSTELYQVLTDVTTNSGGEATLDIWPDLRTVPADNSTVVVNNAKGLFRMDTPNPEWSAEANLKYGITFSMSEAL